MRRNYKLEKLQDSVSYIVGQLSLPWVAFLFAWAFHAYYF